MSSIYLALVLVIVVVLMILGNRRRRAQARITSPRLGFLNLKGAAATPILLDDKSAIGPMFSSVQEGSTTPPPCDVLFLYCDIEPDGRISGSAAGLRDLIRDSGAKIVVLASDNPGVDRKALAEDRGYGYANIVVTLARDGASFTAFFQRLFGLMRKGTSMPLAWVTLVPQNPRQADPGGMQSVFLVEAGQITFGRQDQRR